MSLTRANLLDSCLGIAESYGGNLTVRQLYYRLVATGQIESSQKEYKRVVDILSKARLDGSFPLDWLMDRTRTAEPGDYMVNQDNVDSAMVHAESRIINMPNTLLWRSVWWNQPFHVSVWVEKEALAGVFQGPCEDAGVGLFVCRGYPSISSLYQWAKDLSEAFAANEFRFERAVVLYFGDHDPDGWEIPRSAMRNVEQIATVAGLEIPVVSLERVALNMDQIEAFNPPPFPAKVTSARYAGYFEEHGTDDAWELDALEPRQLAELITDSIADNFDEYDHEENNRRIFEARQHMRRRMMDPEWMRGVLGHE